MILTLLRNYPDLVGAKQIFAAYGNGPSSYSQTTGDPVSIPRTTIDLLIAGTQSVSGTYIVYARPAFGGNNTTWVLHWFVVATGAEVANAVNLSAETVQVGGFYLQS